tara:strand:- start:1153 stop:1389 length:237 start_codon:yes stop_codon:yes gene_type:complete
MDEFEEAIAQRLCLDVHVFGKQTIAGYRSLFSFSNALIICTGSKYEIKADSFQGFMRFLEQAPMSSGLFDGPELFADF